MSILECTISADNITFLDAIDKALCEAIDRYLIWKANISVGKLAANARRRERFQREYLDRICVAFNDHEANTLGALDYMLGQDLPKHQNWQMDLYGCGEAWQSDIICGVDEGFSYWPVETLAAFSYFDEKPTYGKLVRCRLRLWKPSRPPLRPSKRHGVSWTTPSKAKHYSLQHRVFGNGLDVFVLVPEWRVQGKRWQTARAWTRQLLLRGIRDDRLFR